MPKKTEELRRGKYTVNLRMPCRQDREILVSALANDGYKVWVETRSGNIHYVLFELKDQY